MVLNLSMAPLLVLLTAGSATYGRQTNNYIPYVYVPDSFSFNAADPEALVDQLIQASQARGPRVVQSLARIQDNKLIKLLLTNGGTDSEDPCNTGLPEDLAGAAQDLIDMLAASRQELVDVIAAVQQMRTNQGWKFISCSHCQELGQDLLTWLRIGCCYISCSQSGAGLLADTNLDNGYNS